MSCYHPMLASFIGYNKDSGKPMYKLSGNSDVPKRDLRDKYVPCGHCIGCRLDKSREWANRCMAELDHTGKAVFLTLTYRPEDVPIAYFTDDGSPVYTLNKKHVQDFLKRLRYYYSVKEIRFFACGEYGSTFCRPHYHAIIFGLDLSNFEDFRLHGSSPNGQSYFISDKLENIWKHGFCLLAPVSWQACAYVARYTAKGGLSNDQCDALGISRQFLLMSRRPGLGAYYASDHPEKLRDSKLYFDGSTGLTNISSCPMPKFIFKKLELSDPDLYDIIKRQRSRASQLSFEAQLKNTDLDEWDYRAVQERVKLAQTSNLLSQRKEF